MAARGDARDVLPDAEALATALEVLERVAADRGVLSGLSAGDRVRLQKAAGQLARPDPDQRRRLRRALARGERESKKARDGSLRRAAGIEVLRRAPKDATPPPPPGGVGASPSSSEYGAPRKCYVCKERYLERHHFYDQLCPRCGDENHAHRTVTADLRGRVALVTGARVKIGYQAALMLLRAGCRVVSLTRFPRDAAFRYAREPDFADWRDRLSLLGADLRHTGRVERLCRHLDARLSRLDFQIHNACQTVRRPPGFYAHLVAGELCSARDLPPSLRELLSEDEELRSLGPVEARPPALLSQVPTEADLLPGTGGDLAPFPRNLFDQDLQQVDRRTHNSWRLGLREVPTLELLEVLLVNAAAPFLMTARLEGLMRRGGAAPPGTATSGDPARHVVMVSAVEGQFYRQHKTDRHPHTNMAKAALNMLVRTSAPDLLREGIHLNAVDTGWITDEDPIHLSARKAEEHGFAPPLDVVDGAARVLAPIMDGFRTGDHASGVFYKDYRPTAW